MRFVILLSCMIVFILSGMSQTVMKIDFKKPVRENIQRSVDSINKKVASYNKDTTNVDFKNSIKAFINESYVSSLINRDNLFEKINKNNSIIPIEIKSVLDSFKKNPSACPKFDSIKMLKFILGENNDTYIGLILDSSDNALGSFTLSQLNKELFYDKLKRTLASILLCDDESIVTKYIESCRKIEPDLYTQFLEAKEDVSNTDRLAGMLMIRKRADSWLDTTLFIKKPKKGITVEPERKKKFTIHDIQIQFQDGFIENVKIWGKVDTSNTLLLFENDYPIAFSTKKDFKLLIEIRLYEKSNYVSNNGLFLKLGEVISYDQNLINNNKDYSPADQVVTIKGLSEEYKEVALYKEQTTQILEAKVFSDLKGADNENPNGLLQIELSKKLNFFTHRSAITSRINNYVFPWRWICPKKAFSIFGNYGWGNYISPQFSINKIEDNNKRLILNHIDTLTLAADTSKALTYTSTINLLKHQLYRVGFDISILYFDFPSIKSVFNFGLGLHFGRTALQDTLRILNVPTSSSQNNISFSAKSDNNVVQYGVNTFQWGPFVTWQIFPDKRFTINATQRFTWFKALNSNFVQVRDSAHYQKFVSEADKNTFSTTPYNYYSKNEDKPFINLSLFKRCLVSSEIYASFCPNKDNSGKLFFRYRLNWDLLNAKENFHQLQIGFATFISATKEYSKLKEHSGID